MTTFTRRAVLAVPIVLTGAGSGSRRETYGGFALDLSRVPTSPSDALLESLHAQIDLVNSLKIKSEIADWFRSVPLIIDEALREPGEFRNGRLALKDTISPASSPVLLHELLHGWHFQRLPGRLRNPDVLSYFKEAKSSAAFPPRSYMLSNVAEFFAMTASVALWGQAARSPSTRSRLRAVMPDYYDWLVDLFGLRI